MRLGAGSKRRGAGSGGRHQIEPAARERSMSPLAVHETEKVTTLAVESAAVDGCGPRGLRPSARTAHKLDRRVHSTDCKRVSQVCVAFRANAPRVDSPRGTGLPALADLARRFGGWVNPHQKAVVEYLREENRVLKEQLGGRRLEPRDRSLRRLRSSYWTIRARSG